MAGHWNGTTDGNCFRFFTPEQVDQILRDGVRRGRAGTRAAIERILKHETGIERAQLWTRMRQLKYPPREVPYRRASWSEDDDRFLREGYEKGWFGKQEAVRELLKRHPDWRPHVVWKRAAKLGLVQKDLKRGQERSREPWSKHDEQVLLNYTGYKDVRVIGKMLRRSPAAVRARLRVLGKSSRVQKEGYARRALARELRLGLRTLQRLIVQGLLEVRDPRITRKSLDDQAKAGLLPPLPCSGTPERSVPASARYEDTDAAQGAQNLRSNTNSRPSISAKLSRAKRVWAEVAAALNVSVEAIENLITRGALKFYDPRVTEKSLMTFCRRYGALINCDALSRETRDWLGSTLDFVPNSGEAFARRLEGHRKQARVTRRCARCGRSIRGNAFFHHAKACGSKQIPSAATKKEPPGSTIKSDHVPT